MVGHGGDQPPARVHFGAVGHRRARVDVKTLVIGPVELFVTFRWPHSVRWTDARQLSPRRFRQPRLPQGAGRFGAHPDATAHPWLRDLAQLRGRRPGRRQHLRLHRQRHRRIAGGHRRGAGQPTARSSSPAAWGRIPSASATSIPRCWPSPGRMPPSRCSRPCNRHLPRPHDPFADLVPAQGIRLTPRHYAYLKISEGCNNKCSFCIIPSLRGMLASRPHRRRAARGRAAGGRRRARNCW